MSLKQKMQYFRQRWDIALDEKVEFEKLRNRVLFALDKSLGEYILKRRDISNQFAYLVGFSLPSQATKDILSSQLGDIRLVFSSDPVYIHLSKVESEIELIQAIQSLFWILEGDEHGERYIQTFGIELQNVITTSPLINIKLVRRGKSVTLYPAGVKLLDEGVMNEDLLWLEEYPTVATPFEDALRIYLTKEEADFRNLLDNLRVAVERLLQKILGNRKSFENQQSTLLKWLNEKGVHSQVVSLYQTLMFGSYRIYQNDTVKHGEDYSPTTYEVEFMLYLTGTFMRLLLQLKRNNT